MGKTEMNLDELINLHQATGNYTDALSCYKMYDKDAYGHVDCYLKAGQQHTVLALASTFSTIDAEKEQLLLRFRLKQLGSLISGMTLRPMQKEFHLFRSW